MMAKKICVHKKEKRISNNGSKRTESCSPDNYYTITDQDLFDDSNLVLPGSGISFHQFEKPDSRILKTFDAPSDKKFTVVFSTKELTALCPLTKMPDYYTFEIQYIPKKKCIESKSAKLYYESSRRYSYYSCC